ncbi:MAG: HNH endonuclease [Symploca sp. SIO2E6]|nr:HNH endonuclease [Symploca sp. SIO2E6]
MIEVKGIDNWLNKVSKIPILKLLFTVIRFATRVRVFLVYWSLRGMKLPGIKTRVKNLLKIQKGVCPVCKQLFMPEDLMEVDHIIPTSMGGKDWYNNLQLLHKHRHHFKTARDGTIASKYDENPF